MTTIRAGDGWSYTITETDYLWIGRAASGEGGSARAVIWTWMQRYALPGFRQRFSSLGALVQAHSQPVNPIWRREGSKCREGGQYHGTDHCSESRLARREHYATLSPMRFSLEVKAAIAGLRAGILPNPVPKCVDFADRTVSEGFVRRNPGSRIYKCIRGNCHIRTADSERWRDDWVTIGEGSSVGAAGIAILAVIVLGAAIWFGARMVMG